MQFSRFQVQPHPQIKALHLHLQQFSCCQQQMGQLHPRAGCHLWQSQTLPCSTNIAASALKHFPRMLLMSTNHALLCCVCVCSCCCCCVAHFLGVGWLSTAP